MIDEPADARRSPGSTAFRGLDPVEAVLHDDTGMPLERTARVLSIAASASCALVQSRTRSAAPVRVSDAVTSASSATAEAAAQAEAVRRTRLSFSPRAVTSTSWPARSSSAAKVPPMAPAPITAILMLPA